MIDCEHESAVETLVMLLYVGSGRRAGFEGSGFDLAAKHERKR